MLKKSLIVFALLGLSTPVIGEEFDLTPEKARRVLNEGKVISSGILATRDGSSSHAFIYWEGEVYQCRFLGMRWPFREDEIPPRVSCYGPARIE